MCNTTEELESELNKTKSMNQLQKLQREKEEAFSVPDALAYLLDTVNKHGFDKKTFTKAVIQQSALERSYVYHLLSGEYGLTRDKYIQFAIVGGFTLEETNKLLKYAHMATLYARDTRDAVLIYCLQQKLSLIDVNMTLDDLGHEPLK